MLTGIDIRGYPPFDALRLDGFGGINLFVGGNGAGKSALLQALYQLARQADDSNLYRPTGGGTASLELGFTTEIGGRVASIGGSLATPPRDVNQSVNGNRNAGFGESHAVQNRGTNAVASLLLHDTGVDGIHAEDAQRLVRVEASGRHDELLALVRLAEPKLQHLAVHRGRNEAPAAIWCDIGLPDRLPLSQLGTGAVCLTRLGLATHAAAGARLLVDNIGRSLHHTIHAPVWRHLAGTVHRDGTQVFGTTASRETVAAAHAADNDLRLYRLETGPDGHRAAAYSPDALAASFKFGFEIR